MHNSFRDGFEKRAKSRMIKEIIKNPNLVSKFNVRSGIDAAYQQARDALSSAAKGSYDPKNRHHLEAALGVHNMRYPHIEDALPQRKHLYVGRGEDTVRMEPRIPVFGRPKSAGGESWVESHNRPYADRIKKTRESLQSGDFYSDYEQQLEHVPFRKPFSKKTVNVASVQKEDVAFDPSIKSISANVEGLPPSSLYGYQAGSTGHKANMFNSRLPNRHGSQGYKEIRMSVPEKEVIYRTNNTANSDIRKNLGNPPMSPEMVVPARYLNKENTK